MRLPVLAAICFQAAASEGQTVLDRVSERVRANIRNITRYTCEEAIERSWYAGNTLERSDRIRLDVAVGSTGEMFAWHGDRSFRSGAVDELIKTGPISSGSFSSFLINIFTPAAAKVKFHGDGEFSYSMPLNQSTFLIGTGSGRVLTSYEGSFTADASTGRLSSLQIRSDSLPRKALMSSLDMRVSYVASHLGDAEVDLPATVTMDVTDLQRDRTRSITTYRNCHQFLGESVLRFDDVSSPEQAVPKGASTAPAIPAGRDLSIRILSSIQPSSAWAGDRIEGVLLTNIAGVAPKGTRLWGHLVKVEHLELRQSSYNLDLLFDELELQGVAHPIHLQAVAPAANFAPDRPQLTIADGESIVACRFRIANKNENLKNAVTHWKS